MFGSGRIAKPVNTNKLLLLLASGFIAENHYGKNIVLNLSSS
jgi:hypothetical protein